MKKMEFKINSTTKMVKWTDLLRNNKFHATQKPLIEFLQDKGKHQLLTLSFEN